MSVQLIISRISQACAEGVLKPLPDIGSIPQLSNIGDLLQPWDQVYPGSALPDEDSHNRGVFGYKKLQRPLVLPRARRSFRPLPPPRKIMARPKLISPGLFASVKAIWDWYQARNVETEQLQSGPVTGAGIAAFIEPLYQECGNRWPLCVWMEEIGTHTDVIGMNGISVMLPHEDYNDSDTAGVVEGFLRGAEGVYWLLQHLYSDGGLDIDLPRQDHALIETVGFDELTSCYATAPGPKKVDLIYLENWDQNFFGTVSEKYPEQWANDYPIISGNGGGDSDMTITCAADIDFAFEFYDAFQAMIDSIPTPWMLTENSDGETEELIHDVCQAWRRVNGKRSVKWTSPKKQTISYRTRIGAL